MNRKQAMGTLVSDTFWQWAQLREMSPQARDKVASLIGDEYDLEPRAYAIVPGGESIVGGQFTRWHGDLGGTDYIASWNGETWSAIEGNAHYGHHIWDTCAFCGKKVVAGVDACLSCGAPTPYWWPHLDQKIADWKRGLAG